MAFSIVVVAGINESQRFGGTEKGELETGAGVAYDWRAAVSELFVASKIEEHTDIEVRTTVLGLRNWSAAAARRHDRIWATRVGAGAYDAVSGGQSFGTIPVVRDNNVDLSPFRSVIGGQRQVPREIYELCSVFF